MLSAILSGYIHLASPQCNFTECCYQSTRHVCAGANIWHHVSEFVWPTIKFWSKFHIDEWFLFFRWVKKTTTNENENCNTQSRTTGKKRHFAFWPCLDTLLSIKNCVYIWKFINLFSIYLPTSAMDPAINIMKRIATRSASFSVNKTSIIDSNGMLLSCKI